METGRSSLKPSVKSGQSSGQCRDSNKPPPPITKLLKRLACGKSKSFRLRDHTTPCRLARTIYTKNMDVIILIFIHVRIQQQSKQCPLVAVRPVNHRPGVVEGHHESTYVYRCWKPQRIRNWTPKRLDYCLLTLMLRIGLALLYLAARCSKLRLKNETESTNSWHTACSKNTPHATAVMVTTLTIAIACIHGL